ncbi:Glycosyltransferase [Heracleum sosnowskyi]|uniref:Glycosyltransferases n=1 Tax=Heracleum sosnowskyi TaxID=360622 RepID=A0AAD8JH82_9APIA|nr:Glycosyltransferase [Heracleum sosnowskyi]
MVPPLPFFPTELIFFCYEIISLRITLARLTFRPILEDHMERSKKKLQLWKKAVFHFFLCFTMGFFTGFIPTGDKSWAFFNHVVATTQSEFPLAIPSYHNQNRSLLEGTHPAVLLMRSNESLNTGTSKQEQAEELGTDKLNSRRLVIIVTPTSVKNQLRGVLLMRLASTLKHVVFKQNITDLEMEMDHQRNVALNHIEQHRLSGIVHFAGLDNVYDLSFFNEIRATEVFGTWPMAFVSANRERVIIEGPVCDSSEVIGWHFKKQKDETAATTGTNKSPLHISSFAFNSSILWDPERWGRPSSIQDTSQQKTMKFVEKEVLEEETELKGIPAEGCSKIMLWNLLIPTKTPPPHQSSVVSQSKETSNKQDKWAHNHRWRE